MSSYITVNGSYGNTSGQQGPPGPPGAPGLLDLPYPDVLTLTPSIDTDPNFVITNSAGASQIEIIPNNGTGVPILNMPTGEIICDTITATTLSFTDETVEKLTIDGPQNPSAFQVITGTTGGGTACFNINNMTGVVSINALVDGTMFTIQNAATTNQLTFNTSKNQLALTGTLIAATAQIATLILNALTVKELTITPSTDGQAFLITNAAGTSQLNFNTSTDELTMTGTASIQTILANNISGTGALTIPSITSPNITVSTLLNAVSAAIASLTIKPPSDDEAFLIENAAGSAQITHNTNTNIFNSSGTISANKLVGQTLTIQNATNQSVLMIANSSDVIQFQFNTANGGNLLLQPSTDGEILTVNNATGTKQINHNTATNTLTGTGILTFPTVETNTLTSLSSTFESVLISPSPDGVCLTIKDDSTYHNTLLTFDSSKNQLGLPKDYASIFLCTGNSYGYLWTNYYGPGDVLNLSFNYYMVSPVNGGSASAVIPDNGYAPAMISLSNGTIAFQIAPAINVAPSPVCSISSNTLFPASSGSFNIGSSSTPLGSLYSNNVNATTLTTTTSNAGTINLTNNIVPTTANNSNIGTTSIPFDNIYVDNATVESITAQNSSYVLINGGDLVMNMNGSSTTYNIRPYHSTYGSVGTSSDPWGTCTAVQWATTSDKRLKKKVQNNRLGLDFINKISTVSYNYDYKLHTGEENEKVNGKKRYGVIAQELEELLENEEIEFSGLIKPEAEDDFYSVDYTQFIAPLIKAVQELTLKVERLENELGRKKSGSGDEFETVDFSD